MAARSSKAEPVEPVVEDEVVTEPEAETPEATEPTDAAPIEPVDLEVRSPADGFSGDVLGVTFTKGIAHTSDPVALAYFRRRGYTVAPEA